MVDTIEQFRALFPEITEEEIANRLETKRNEEARAQAVVEAERKVQSLRDLLADAERERDSLNG